MKSIIIVCIGFIAINTNANGIKSPLKDRFSYQAGRSDTLPAISTTLTIPVVSGSLTIDGKLNDAFWQSASTQPLTNHEIDHLGQFGQGGEFRIAERGDYLCMSARIPETERVVANSTGINPTWEREDMIAWRLKYVSPINHKTIFATIAVNPLGALSLFAGDSHYYGSIGDDVINSRKRLIAIHGAVDVPNSDFVKSTGTALAWVSDILAAVTIGQNEWTVELALPLKQFGPIGFMSIERVRAPRPTAPELSWYWPAPNVRAYYELGRSNQEPSPLFPATGLPGNPVINAPETPGSSLANEVTALPKQAWTREEQESLGTRDMLKKSIQSRMAGFAQEEKLAWQKVNTVKDWERFRDKGLTAMRNQIGPLPERTPLHETVTRRSNIGDGFVIENIVYESRPHFVVTANLYLPEHSSGKIPAVIVLHALHGPKTQMELQDLGMTWARSGTAVLVLDQINAGERSQSQPWGRESNFGRYATGNQLYLAGESLIKWMSWDIMRSIDLLVTRPNIDSNRIVLIGSVAGGGDPAALTANLDSRVAAVIPFNFGEAGPEEHYLQGPRPYDFETADPGWGEWETTRNLPNSVPEQFFPWFLCASVAPRPFIFSFELGWPKTVEEEPAWARYKKVFGLYGVRDHLAEVHGLGPFPGAGETNQISTYLRQQIDPILNRWLQIPIPENEYHNIRSESELTCLTPVAAVEYKPEPVSSLALELALERLAASRAKRAGLPEVQRKKILREELKQKLGDIDPVHSPMVSSLWTKQYPNFSMEAITIKTEPGITLPVFLLTPKTGPKRRSVVIALAEGGKENFLSSRSNEIASLLSDGVTVCLPDVRGTGELSDHRTRGPEAMSLSASELMLGRTLIGSQLKDTRTIFRWLAGRSDTDPSRIAVWGDSFSEPNAPDFQFDQSPGRPAGPVNQRQAEPLGPFLAILTALYEDHVTAVACSGGLVSFASVLEDRFCQIPQDVIVPGILEVTDLGEIVASIAPRPVLLEKPVNGLNKKVPLSIMEKEYSTGGSNVILREGAGNPSLAVWLSKQYLKK
jgi:dienelactone hydrolase